MATLVSTGVTSHQMYISTDEKGYLVARYPVDWENKSYKVLKLGERIGKTIIIKRLGKYHVYAIQGIMNPNLTTPTKVYHVIEIY